MAGRPKGSENKLNGSIRHHFDLLLQRKAPQVEAWLDTVAQDDPAKAIDCLTKLAEFVLPKLARQELTSTNTHTHSGGVSFTIKPE
jgi:uncharacterized protein YegL